MRIIRACNEMGIRTVAVYSEADAQALHVNLADESYCIGPALLKDSYLNMTAIIDVAIATGCQAIHPGYGLLSENPRFAELCEKCNIKFIGPHYSVIARMGDKDEARRTMKAAGVPVVPAWTRSPTSPRPKSLLPRSATPSSSRRRRAAAGAASASSGRKKTSRRRCRRLPPRRRAPSATASAIWKSISPTSNTSRCRSSRTSRATSSAWASATAPCSARTRS